MFILGFLVGVNKNENRRTRIKGVPDLKVFDIL